MFLNVSKSKAFVICGEPNGSASSSLTSFFVTALSPRNGTTLDCYGGCNTVHFFGRVRAVTVERSRLKLVTRRHQCGAMTHDAVLSTVGKVHHRCEDRGFRFITALIHCPCCSKQKHRRACNPLWFSRKLVGHLNDDVRLLCLGQPLCTESRCTADTLSTIGWIQSCVA